MPFSRRLRQFVERIRRRRKSRWQILGNAEAALEAGRTKKAQRLLEPYIAQNPSDVDAWVLLAASRGTDHLAIIWDLERVPTPTRRTPILAMLLALAHARVGNGKAALEWAEAADADPEIGRKLQSQPEMQRLRAPPSLAGKPA